MMRKLCLSGFRLVALVCCLVASPFAVYDWTKTNDNMPQRSSSICVCYARSAPKMVGEIHRIRRNMSLSIIQEIIKMWWSTFIEGHVDIIVDNVAMNDSRMCSIEMFD